MDQKIQACLREYHARRRRNLHPSGTFDRQGRWYPSEDECQICCDKIRSPSEKWPNSLNKHCRSLEHVCNLFGVEISEVKKHLTRKCVREKGVYYKQVAYIDGRFLSIFDGETEYKIGEEMFQTVRKDHNGGFYVYKKEHDAVNAAFPKKSKLRDTPKALLKMECRGNYCRYEEKIAFSNVKPIECLGLIKKTWIEQPTSETPFVKIVPLETGKENPKI